jgi:hypothetical protein
LLTVFLELGIGHSSSAKADVLKTPFAIALVKIEYRKLLLVPIAQIGERFEPIVVES